MAVRVVVGAEAKVLAVAKDFRYTETAGSAVWAHAINAGEAPARTAVGINHANQDKDNRDTFIAGAMVGLAGGALLAALQEGLHATTTARVERSNDPERGR